MPKEIIHGGNIYAASKVYGFKKKEFLDYSSNVNPLGLPDRLRERLIANLDFLECYPDPDCMELKEDISNYLDIVEGQIIIGNGASEIIYLFMDVLKSKKLLIPAPAFSEYANAAENFKVEVKYFEMAEDTGFKLDIDILLTSIELDTDTIFLCNPNNPTSTMIDQEEIIKLLDFCSKRNIYVIIDETFIELTKNGNMNSAIAYLNKYDNLFIIRAFTKLFAIPGLRLGYGIGNPAFIKKMWAKKHPWSVNSLACNLGNIMVYEKAYLERTTVWLGEELDWFYKELLNFKDFKVYKPNTNFVLLKILNNRWDSSTLKQRMAFRGVLIREALNFKFLDNKYIRLAIKDRANNIQFLKIFTEVLKEINN